MARIVAQYEATNYGKSELAALQSAFDVINKVVVGLTAGAAAQATAAAESSACHLAEIDALTAQLNETEAAAEAATAEAARTIQTLTDQAANLAADLAAARTIQAALAATVTAQVEQITTYRRHWRRRSNNKGGWTSRRKSFMRLKRASNRAFIRTGTLVRPT